MMTDMLRPGPAGRARSRPLAVAALVVALTAAGAAAAAAPAGATTGAVQVAASVPAPVTTQGVRVYFLNRSGTLVPVYRTVTVRGGAVAAAAVTALLQGPAPAERAAGIRSAVPVGTALRGITIRDGTAVVDLARRFAGGGGSASMRGRWAELVWTLTQFTSAQRVSLRLDGRPVTVLGGEGLLIGRTATRAQWTLIPDIFIDSPAWGQPVTSPVTVTGWSRYVYESQFLVDVRTVSGTVLSRTLAWGSPGAFRPFTVTVPYQVNRHQAGRVVAFSFSAENGKPMDVVQVPVTLRTTDRADGRYPVRVLAVDAAARTISVRMVQFFTGTAAAQAAAQDHAAEVPPPNDYWIRDTSGQVRVLPVAADAVITTNTLTAAESHSAVRNVRIPLSRLATLRGRAGALFWITLRQGQVTAITQQYLP